MNLYKIIVKVTGKKIQISSTVQCDYAVKIYMFLFNLYRPVRMNSDADNKDMNKAGPMKKMTLRRNCGSVQIGSGASQRFRRIYAYFVCLHDVII